MAKEQKQIKTKERELAISVPPSSCALHSCDNALWSLLALGPHIGPPCLVRLKMEKILVRL